MNSSITINVNIAIRQIKQLENPDNSSVLGRSIEFPCNMSMEETFYSLNRELNLPIARDQFSIRRIEFLSLKRIDRSEVHIFDVRYMY